MAVLKSRIATQHKRQVPARPVTGGRAVGSAVPASELRVQPGTGAELRPLTPMTGADGAMLPGAGPGGPDTLHPAGRM